MISASVDEVLDLIRKWEGEVTPLECRFVALGCVCAFPAEVSNVFDSGFRVAEPDGEAFLEIAFNPSLQFFFDDPRRFVAGVGETLIIRLRRDSAGSNDLITLSQLDTKMLPSE